MTKHDLDALDAEIQHLRDIQKELLAVAWMARNAIEDLDLKEIGEGLQNPSSATIQHEHRERQKQQAMAAIARATPSRAASSQG